MRALSRVFVNPRNCTTATGRPSSSSISCFIMAVSNRFGVAPFLISRWKRQAQENLSELFISTKNNKELQEKDELIERLYRELGKLQVEHEWLKKKLGVLE